MLSIREITAKYNPTNFLCYTETEIILSIEWTWWVKPAIANPSLLLAIIAAELLRCGPEYTLGVIDNLELIYRNKAERYERLGGCGKPYAKVLRYLSDVGDVIVKEIKVCEK